MHKNINVQSIENIVIKNTKTNIMETEEKYVVKSSNQNFIQQLSAAGVDLTEYSQSIKMTKNFNIEPPKEWVKKNKLTKTDHLPISVVEQLLDLFFPLWEVKIVNYQVILNSISVHIRLKVKYPDGSIRVVDGVGAAPIQQDSGSEINDTSSVKKTAIQMALPIAKSFALKDAADHLGKIFGRDLSREFQLNLSEKMERISNSIEQLKSEL